MDIINSLNTNKYFFGIVMILMNIGSKYAVSEISILQHNFLNHKIIRRLLLFTIFFVATRDVIISLIMTAVFIVVALELFNENSKHCVLPKNITGSVNKNINMNSPKEIEKLYLDYKSKGIIK